MKDNFTNISYKRHENEYKIEELDATVMKDTDSVNAFRHQRMYDTLNVLINYYKKSNWLVVGDGNYGAGAHHIIQNGANALATDISVDFLKKAKEIGHITDYKKANAEQLPFDDNEFDFSFCKESYHHFPRPMIALYEMLRVAKKGIVLIEPNDAFTGKNLLRTFLRFIKRVLGKKIQRHSYEEVGNYVYTISRREIEKVALGLNYKVIAFKGINDHYIVGAQKAKMSENSKIKSDVLKTIRQQDLFCKFRLTDYALLTAVILKQIPSRELLENLENDGFEINILPNNPYVETSHE